MKKMKKLFSLVMALAMVMSLTVAANAAGTRTITVTPPTGTGSTTENTYEVYKVFDAVYKDGVGISYKLVSGKTEAPAGFAVDAVGNVTYTGTSTNDELTADDIAAIAGYVKASDKVGEIKTTGENSGTLDVEDGYYYITTGTGSLVTVASTNPNVTVQDKNTVPTVVKKSDNKDDVIVAAGKTVDFTVTLTVGAGCKNYVLHDVMGTGLELVANTLKVNGTVAADSDLVKDVTPAAGETITIAFVDGIAKDTQITVTYSAKVASDALSSTAAKNGAWVTYGDDNNPTPTDDVKVYNAKFTVTKVDGEGDALAGAGFVLQNAEGKYYSITNDKDVEWVDLEDATELKSTEDSNVMIFTGLENGTYTLIENTVPDGYNKAANQTLTITDSDVTTANLEQETTVENNAGIELPSTGGIGTTIFTVVGGVLMVGAAVLFITKKRSED